MWWWMFLAGGLLQLWIFDISTFRHFRDHSVVESQSFVSIKILILSFSCLFLYKTYCMHVHLKCERHFPFPKLWFIGDYFHTSSLLLASMFTWYINFCLASLNKMQCNTTTMPIMLQKMDCGNRILCNIGLYYLGSHFIWVIVKFDGMVIQVISGLYGLQISVNLLKFLLNLLFNETHFFFPLNSLEVFISKTTSLQFPFPGIRGCGSCYFPIDRYKKA